MLANQQHCEVITLSDDDTVLEPDTGRGGQMLTMMHQNSIIRNNGTYQQESCQLYQQRIFQKSSINDTKVDVSQPRHNGQQRFKQPNTFNGGVTMAIMKELPLELKTLDSKLCPIAHSLPPPLSKNSPMTVKEQLTMFFQQQQKMQNEHKQLRTTSATVPGSKGNGINSHEKSILDKVVKGQQTQEWHPTYNIPLLLPSQKLKTQMVRTRANNFTSGKRLHSDNLSLFCDTYIEAHNKRNGSSGVEEEFTAQFQCTFQECNKRLKNNVMFIYHIWAHVAQQKPMDSDEQFTNLQLMAEQQNANANGKNNGIVAGSGVTDTALVDEQRSDVTRLHMCPECLLEQPTPYRARLHYHRVHKRGKRPLLDNKHGLNVCNICEQVIDTKTMSAHIACHHLPDGSNQLALPYWCRFSTGTKCQFRTSNRGALLKHFCTKHVGTRVVLCPFCLMSFSVPPADKRFALVRMRNFVQHMAQHDAEKSRYCGLCVTRFPVSLRQQMKTHQDQHGKHNDDQKWLQWPLQRLNLNDVMPDKSRALVSSDVSMAQCVECGQMVHNLSKHFEKEKRSCNFCAFATRCARAMERHRLLGQCNGANKARIPFAGWTSSVSVSPLKLNVSASAPSSMSLFQFACTFCSTFRSVNVQVMFEHFAKVHKMTCAGLRVRLLRHTNKDNNAGTNNSGKIMAKPIGGKEEQLQMNVDKQLKKYTMEVIKEESHESELFGLQRMGDVSLEQKLQQQQEKEQTNDNLTSDATTSNSSEQVEALREWLLTFLPLFHANRLIQCTANRQEQTRLLSAMMAQDDGAVDADDNAPLLRKTLVEEHMKEERIKMNLMFDY